MRNAHELLTHERACAGDLNDITGSKVVRGQRKRDGDDN